MNKSKPITFEFSIPADIPRVNSVISGHSDEGDSGEKYWSYVEYRIRAASGRIISIELIRFNGNEEGLWSEVGMHVNLNNGLKSHEQYEKELNRLFDAFNKRCKGLNCQAEYKWSDKSWDDIRRAQGDRELFEPAQKV